MGKGAVYLFGFFSFLIISIGYASALNNCEDSQIILRLYSTSNSHGEVWNGTGNYGIRICYNEIFGKNYTGNMPHSNSGNNTVLKLSAFTNAHSEGPAGTNYNVNVNYGDLVCRIVASNIVKNNNEREIVSLSSQTNAHIALPGVYAGAGNYKILCSSSFAESIVQTPGLVGEVYWADGSGNKISSVCVNHTAYMFVRIEGNNNMVNFEIYEKDLVSDDNIRTVRDGNQINGRSDGSGFILAQWSVTNSDLSKAGLENPYEFYFNASINGSSNATTPPHLDVLNMACENRPPIAVISTPEHRQIYFAGTEIYFEESSYDLDGLIRNYSWDIKYNDSQEFSSDQRNFSYTFNANKPGMRTITLRVVDDSGAVSEDQISILIIGAGNNGLLAFINQPRHRQIIIGDDRLSVAFSANDSYVINNSVTPECSGIINCLAGNCPNETKNSLPSCTANRISVSNTPQPFSDLYFNWSFVNIGYGFEGFGNFSGVQPFGIPSSQFNDKIISLQLNYTRQGTSLYEKIDRRFTLLTEERCLRGQNLFLTLDDNGFVSESKSIYGEGGCVGPDGVPNETDRGDDCCNAGEFCIKQGSSPPSCVISANASNFTKCGDYKNRDECNTDRYNVARNIDNPERLSSPRCGTTVNGAVVQCGSCVWESGRENGTECALNKTYQRGSGGGGGGLLPDDCTGTVASCSVGYNIIEPCNGRYEIANISKVFTPGTGSCSALTAQAAECVDEGPFQYLCGRPTIALPFFGIWQAIAAVLIVAALYLAIFRKEIGKFIKKIRKKR